MLAAHAGRSLLALAPATGRTHQLRLHCAHALGAPIVGDRLYGVAGAAEPRLLLHAAAVLLPGAAAPVAAPWPDEIRRWAQSHGVRVPDEALVDAIDDDQEEDER